jgi:predicted transcriptional regulator
VGVALIDRNINKFGMTADPTLLATTKIVTAWVRSHDVAAAAVSDLIREVYGSLTYREPDLPYAGRMMPAKPERKAKRDTDQTNQPAVDIRKSVFTDHLVCLEDGKSFKTLKRHLNEVHGMTPDQYRAKWDLPGNYPMIASNYAKERSRISRATGLGKRR